ncbi:unnamed protein product [Cuscuta epithymum]|uniref:Leucine-rich repeat-containing N-terminal plant-type domain-containing protein n=1 Tax=Cuscuta epithymum TaxID=186058 RepID=A0AAV0DLZ7_9ASTE|nr:unnamed protein product [Cuscuta epithymum]
MMKEGKKWQRRNVGRFWSGQVVTANNLLLLLYTAAFAVRTEGLDQTDLESLEYNVMMELNRSLTFPAGVEYLWNWSHPDPCKWSGVLCAYRPYQYNYSFVFIINIEGVNISGTLPGSLGNLTQLYAFAAADNRLTGPLPDFAGCSYLGGLGVARNLFTSIPPTLFRNKTVLYGVSLDYNILLQPWKIPEDLSSSSHLTVFKATGCNINGDFPSFFNNDIFPNLTHLQLANNHLSGHLPPSLPQRLETLWLSNQTGTAGSGLSGSISGIRNLSHITQLYLHRNKFSGEIPEVSSLRSMTEFIVRDNNLTGPVPESLAGISTLIEVDLSNNNLNGSVPNFKINVTTCGNPGLGKRGRPC